MDLRTKGKTLLDRCNFSPDQVAHLEKLVNTKSKTKTSYNNTMMDIYDFVTRDNFSYSQICEIVETEKIEWSHPDFKDIADEQAEIFSYIENPFEVVEGMFSCPKCGNKKNVSYSKQVRSSDEGMSTFVFCSNKLCRHSWVYSG